jgi:Protein of unknown function (DUF1778).
MSKEAEFLRLAVSYDSGPIQDEEIGEAGRALSKMITLSEQDWHTFQEGLTNPPKPNKALKAAFKRHQQPK